jgi:ribosomal protein S18 acetylase RimI-like enzyme
MVDICRGSNGFTDSNSIADVHYRAFQSLVGSLSSSTAPKREFEKRWRTRLAEAAEDLILACESSRVVGFLFLSTDQEKAQAEIVSFYVQPESQGQGLGGLLVAQGLSELNERRIHQVDVWVWDSNTRARDFYLQRGFVATFESRDRSAWQVPIREERLTLTLS